MMRRLTFAISYLGVVALAPSCGPYRNMKWMEENVVFTPNENENLTDPPAKAARELRLQKHREIVAKWVEKSPRVETGEYKIWAEQVNSGKFSGSVLFRATAPNEKRVIASCHQLVIEGKTVSMSRVYQCIIGEAVIDTAEETSLVYQIDSGIYDFTGPGRTHIEIPME